MADVRDVQVVRRDGKLVIRGSMGGQRIKVVSDTTDPESTAKVSIDGCPIKDPGLRTVLECKFLGAADEKGLLDS
jgi:hypothetical protein